MHLTKAFIFDHSVLFLTSFVNEETRATLEKNSKYETVDNVDWTQRVTVFEFNALLTNVYDIGKVGMFVGRCTNLVQIFGLFALK